MVDESRIGIYDYLYSLLYDVVTKNVYSMAEPTDNTKDDAENGFIVTRVGTIQDQSEFSGETYAQVRCYIIAYIPKKTRGRLNKELYKEFEDGILEVIHNAENTTDETYYIMPDTTISMDDNETSQKGNQFHTFVKSFIVVIDKQSE